MARKDTDFIYYGEAKKELKQMVTDTVMNMMLSPKYDGKGMEADEVAAYDARIAHYNDGIMELARNLLRQLDEEGDPDE